MSSFRKAKCIEMHDTNTTLALSDCKYYEDFFLAGRTDSGKNPPYFINLFDLSKLADMLGFDVNEIVRGDRDGERENIHSVEIKIGRSRRDVAEEDNIDIVSLKCNVISSNLVEIEVFYKFSETKEDEPERQLITYSGSFSIWWE